MAVIHLYDANGNILWLTETTHFDFNHYAVIATTLCMDEGDGLLVFNPETGQVNIINADGSDGEFCANGLQATAFHAGRQSMTLNMAGQKIQALLEGRHVSILLNASSHAPKQTEWSGVKAYAIKMPNPHLIFLSPPQDWSLQKEGKECCLALNTNVEWVQRERDYFIVNVYERGAGITAACGSGALAVFEVLRYLGEVTDTALIKMPGGILTVEARGSTLSLQGQVRLLKSKVV